MTTVTREHLAGLELARECVGHSNSETSAWDKCDELDELISQASAAPEQEAVAYCDDRALMALKNGTAFSVGVTPASQRQDGEIHALYLSAHPQNETAKCTACKGSGVLRRPGWMGVSRLVACTRCSNSNSAEIERLRAERGSLKRQAEHLWKALDERDEKLVEAQALQEEAYRDGWNSGQEALEQRYQDTPRSSNEGWERFKAENALSATAQPAEKYDDVLLPFLVMMRKELHANSGKGDRRGWLGMTPGDCLLELYYHLAKCQKAVKDGNPELIAEHTADVANMSMMLADIYGLIAAQPAEVKS